MAQTYDHAPPDAEERYGRAIDSKHLRAEAVGHADVDQLIAAGWLRDSLGTTLWRLRREWDLVRSDVLRARQAHASAFAVAFKLSKKGQEPVAPEAPAAALEARQKAAAEAVERMSEAEREALRARALAMVMLKTLRPARDAVGAFALGLAVRSGFLRGQAEVLAVAGKALELYVDPQCGHCHGRGMVEVEGGVPTLCPVCHGSRRRHLRLGPDDESERFGDRLICELERKTDHVADRIRSFTKLRHTPPGSAQQACAELEQRLQQLRSAGAQED